MLSGGVGYTGTGQANLGQGFTQQTSAFVQSNWQARLTYQLDGARLIGPGQQKANLKATDEEIDNEARDTAVQHHEPIPDRARPRAAQVAVSRQQVERNQSFLELAQARFKVGQGTLIEVRQAEVQKGTADVQLLRDQQAENEAKLELFRQMGVAPPVEVQHIALTDSFPVTEPTFELDDAVADGCGGKPGPPGVALPAGRGVVRRRRRQVAVLSLALCVGRVGRVHQPADR